MELHLIETAPISTDTEKHHILLYWDDINHYEDGWIYKGIYKDKYFGIFHILYDGHTLKNNPTHWCILPKKD